MKINGFVNTTANSGTVDQMPNAVPLPRASDLDIKFVNDFMGLLRAELLVVEIGHRQEVDRDMLHKFIDQYPKN